MSRSERAGNAGARDDRATRPLDSTAVAPAATVVFVVSEDWYFLSHRLPQARAVRDLGCRVVVATRLADGREAISREGFEVRHVPFDRGGVNPLAELRAVLVLARVIMDERPDVIHAVGIKPILDAGFAVLPFRRVRVVNAYAGLGTLLAGTRRRALAWLVRRALALVSRINKAYVLVQNADDRAAVLRTGLAATGRVSLIPGSGVDAAAFAPDGERDGRVAVLMVARLLRAKGVADFVEAARVLRDRGYDMRFLVVGTRDPANRDSVSEVDLAAWRSIGPVEFLGQRADIASLWRQAHIAVLPSHYGEGVPKSLLEAAASGRPIITTDTPGCRDLVPGGRTGRLVPPGDTAALASAIAELADDPPLRRRLGEQARALVLARFADEKVAAATRALYRELLPGIDPSTRGRPGARPAKPDRRSGTAAKSGDPAPCARGRAGPADR